MLVLCDGRPRLALMLGSILRSSHSASVFKRITRHRSWTHYIAAQPLQESFN